MMKSIKMGNRVSGEDAYNNLVHYLYKDKHRKNKMRIDARTAEIIGKAIKYAGKDAIKQAEVKWRMKYCGISEEDVLEYMKKFS